MGIPALGFTRELHNCNQGVDKMDAGVIGYALGLYLATLACAGIAQFILNKIPLIKRRLVASYVIATVIGAAILSASTKNDRAAIIAGLALFISMFYLYKRESDKGAA